MMHVTQKGETEDWMMTKVDNVIKRIEKTEMVG